MTEFANAFARGSIRLWPVAPDYAVDDGRLVGRGEVARGSTYMPVGHPNLLEEFAKLGRGDSAAVLDFARIRGSLGFPQTAALDDTPGDPLDWIWDHAEQVQIIISLLASRRSQNDDDLLKAISKVANAYAGDDTFVIEFALLNGDFRKVVQNFTYGGHHLHLALPDLADIGLPRAVSALPNINMPSVPRKFQKGNGKYLLLADVIVQEVINRNIDCPTKIIMPEWGHHVRSYVYKNLMEVIYSHLADYANGEQVYVRCRFCGSYFQQKHGRQVFCPPALAGKESLCATRHRKREWHQRQ